MLFSGSRKEPTVVAGSKGGTVAGGEDRGEMGEEQIKALVRAVAFALREWGRLSKRLSHRHLSSLMLFAYCASRDAQAQAGQGSSQGCPAYILDL